MTDFVPPRIPLVDTQGGITRPWEDLLRQMFTIVGGSAGAIDHATLTNLNSALYTHLTAANATDLTDGGDSVLHYHSADRNRTNHTGTQLSTTISDFTEAAQDATGAMAGVSLVYVDATPLLCRAALTGDVTAAQNSNATTIANDAVTYAKMQNVSATDKILGRSTAGAGDVEEIDCTAAGRALIDDASASAQRTTLGLGTLATQSGTFSGTSSGTNTGDQTAASLKVPAYLFTHFADQGNSTTTETDLYTDTVAAGQLTTNGDKLEVEYGGVFVSSGTATRELKIYFAGTAIFDTGLLTVSLAAAWTAYTTIVRVSASVIRYMISLTTEGAALAAYTAVGELTGLTLSNTAVLKVTAQAAGVGAATNDIVAKLGSIIYRPF